MFIKDIGSRGDIYKKWSEKNGRQPIMYDYGTVPYVDAGKALRELGWKAEDVALAEKNRR